MQVSRRHLLGTCALAFAGSVAGCSGSSDTPTGTDEPGSADGDDEGADTPEPPQTEFGFNYGTGPETSMDGELAISNIGANPIPAERLSIQGENLAQTDGWTALEGNTTATVDGQPAVGTADAVFIEADTDFVARVVWSAGDTSAVLARRRGPDA